MTEARILAAIPCYNEARYIGEVVKRAKGYVEQVFVIDDGSKDDTARVAQEAGATVIRHETNYGPGRAARTCLEAGLKHGADILVTLDGDSQHNPDEIPAVVQPIRGGRADLVVGNRLGDAQANMPRYRRFGNDLINWVLNVGAATKIRDGQCCFRAYSAAALRSIHVTDDSFGFASQTLIQARRHGMRILEVPISCVYHGDGSSQGPISMGTRMWVATLKHRVFRD
ncbi:MAG: glycosyltransferase family 2 protein [Chloroflexi bacterium]|nr:glycosyltransferase family 2 protein [Chloroflexota bacterium]